MSDPPPLATRFVEGLAPARRGEVTLGPALETTLATFVEGAARSFPELRVPSEAFIAHVAAHLAPEAPALDALSLLNGADLYLAFAASCGERAAQAAVAKIAERALSAALRRYNPSGTLVEDVTQHVCELLFVGGPDGIPKITLYGGRGSLAAWIKIIGIRAALRLAAAHAREEPAGDDELAARLAGEEDEETRHLKQAYRSAWKRAFQEALAGLSHWDKALLRKHVIQSKGIAELAAQHGVHRATAARWLAMIRQTLLEETRRRLMAELRLDAREVDQVIWLIESRLDASVERLLVER